MCVRWLAAHFKYTSHCVWIDAGQLNRCARIVRRHELANVRVRARVTQQTLFFGKVRQQIQNSVLVRE